MPASTPAWTTPRDVTARLRKRFDNGIYLSELAENTAWEPLNVPLTGPKPDEITRHFDAALAWAESWSARAHPRLRIERRPIGGRRVGFNDIPARVWIDRREDLWSLLGVTGVVDRFLALLASARAALPLLAAWMSAHPMKVVKLEADWPRLQATLDWIINYQGPAVYVRQIDIPGVDTKFIEQHRAVLTVLLENCLPADRVDQEAPRTDFAARFRFLRKPSYLRFRLLGGLTLAGFSELMVRTDEFTAPPSGITTVYVVENETTYLAFPPQSNSMVIHGGGYAVTRLTNLAWLGGMRLIYWGDVDTHGFAILHRLRRAFPHTESVLMDRDVLMSHRDQWVNEASPTCEQLSALTPDEADVYASLVDGEFGRGVRLEQERVRFHLLQDVLHQRRE
ncbi:Wadjet anti-phage system protein JetD domain-containing protein [Streptomyces murinus]